MASHVTYDGVPGSGGTIFKGIKFWVSVSVPQRASIIGKIESNGGVVVPREKDADMLIADHARKNAPPESYSWKFITESVSAGIIQVEDKYLINSPPKEHRSILAGPHAKKARTPFTTHDDALIAKHVLKEEINTAGNVLYMKLAEKYPHHPWQSWRNRWVKFLSFKSDKELTRLARLADVALNSAPTTAEHITRHQREERPQAPRANATSSTGREPSRDRTEPSPRVTRVSTSEAARRSEAASPTHSNKRGHTKAAVHETSGKTVEEGTSQHQDTIDSDEQAAPEEQEVAEDERDGGHDAHEYGQDEAGAELEGQQEEEDDDAQDDVSVDGGPSSFSERDQFFSDLRDYCEASDRRLYTRCVIEDHEVDLFDLYQAVSAQSIPPDEVDWKQVAEDVGLGRSQRKEVTAGLLQSSYNRYLGDFAEAMMSFENNGEDPDEDMAEEDGAVFQDEETAPNLTSPRPSQEHRVLSSTLSGPGETGSRKRSPDKRPTTPERLPKRRRTVHTEIPMTPEDKLRTTGRPSAPSSAPGNLHWILDEEEAETGEPFQVTPQQQPSLEETFDMTPSQQLRSETELVLNPEPADTPTLYFSPMARISGRGTDGRLETIHEEVPSTYTPTRSRPKKRALPPSFEQAQPPPSREQPRERQQQEDRQRAESRRDEHQAHEQDRAQAPQRQRDNGQEQRPQQSRQATADTSDPDEDNVEEKKQQYRDCRKEYLSQGYKEHEIVEAMRRTTMTPGKAMDIVIESLRDGRGVPDNCEGIWTDRDDSQLKYVVRVSGLGSMPGGDGAEQRRRKEKAQQMLDRLLYKHGEARVKLRKKFLRELALAQREMEREMQA